MGDNEKVVVGSVKFIFRYPVKSFAGEQIIKSWVGWHGLDGDRRFAFVRLDNPTGFPWLTAREYPGMLSYTPYFSNPDNVRESELRIRTHDGEDLPISSPLLIERLSRESGNRIHLLQNWGGIFDTMDLSIITTASIKAVMDPVGMDADPRRFRPNLLIEAVGDKPFPEERWIKGLLIFGDRSDSARVRAHRKDLRCMIVNLDPDTTRQNPAILKEIVKSRKNMLGVYGGTERPGTVCEGDLVYLEKD